MAYYSVIKKNPEEFLPFAKRQRNLEGIMLSEKGKYCITSLKHGSYKSKAKTKNQLREKISDLWLSEVEGGERENGRKSIT